MITKAIVIAGSTRRACFLIGARGKACDLPGIGLSRDKGSPLKSVVRILLTRVNVRSRSLQLLSLAGVEKGNGGVPLFIFSSLRGPSSLSDLLGRPDGFT